MMNAQMIRPIRDDIGFCWNAEQMDTLISYLNRTETESPFPAQGLVAGISPHDDYLYAAKVYYPLYRLIQADEIVIFGVTHGTVRSVMNDPRDVLIFDDFPDWHGPYGKVAVSPLRNDVFNNLPTGERLLSDQAQTIEHSIEALIPFLQYYNRNVRLTPIMVTGMSFNRMDSLSTDLAQIIARYMKTHDLQAGKDIFFLISADLNHYGGDFNNTPFGDDAKAHHTGTVNDQRIAHEAIGGRLTLEKVRLLTEELWSDLPGKPAHPLWCGQYSIPFGLLTTMKIINQISGKSLEGEIFRYSDTWTGGVLPVERTSLGITAPFSLKHWVGFMSAGLYLQ